MIPIKNHQKKTNTIYGNRPDGIVTVLLAFDNFDIVSIIGNTPFSWGIETLK